MFRTLSLLTLLACTVPAVAQEEPEPASYTTQGEVTVTAKASGPLDSTDVLTSVNVVGRDQIESISVAETLELLRRVPGIYMETFNQGVVSADLGIRGFNTQGDVAHSTLIIDGVPSTLHTGYNDMKAIFPLQVDRIEVVKGTNDPRYGLNNVAGNVNIVTRSAGNAFKVTAGSFGTVESEAMLSFGDARLLQNYFVGHRKSEGYRDHSGSEKLAASAKWLFAATDRLTITGIARLLDFDADAPGYLTNSEARSAPVSVHEYARHDGGEQENRHGSVHADFTVSPALSYVARAYLQTFDRARWVRFDASTAQQERLEDEEQVGFISVLTLRPPSLAERGVAFEWGVDLQNQENVHQRYRTSERDRQALLRHHDFTFRSAGTYVQASGNPAAGLRIVAGLRADRLQGDFHDRLASRTLPMNDYGTIVQPKLSAIYTFLPAHGVYANYGRTFQTGVGIGAYRTQPHDLAPSINDGYEAGYRFAPSPRLTSRVALWRQDASNEVRLKYDASGESENVGRTQRRGIDVETSFVLASRVTGFASYSRHTSEQVDPGAGLEARRGKELDHIPTFTAKAGLDFALSPRMQAGLAIDAQGDYEVTKENDRGRFGRYTTLSADLSYLLGRWKLGAHVTNLLDADYDTSVWYKDFGAMGTQHNPGEPRAFALSIGSEF